MRAFFFFLSLSSPRIGCPSLLASALPISDLAHASHHCPQVQQIHAEQQRGARTGTAGSHFSRVVSPFQALTSSKLGSSGSWGRRGKYREGRRPARALARRGKPGPRGSSPGPGSRGWTWWWEWRKRKMVQLRAWGEWRDGHLLGDGRLDPATTCRPVSQPRNCSSHGWRNRTRGALRHLCTAQLSAGWQGEEKRRQRKGRRSAERSKRTKWSEQKNQTRLKKGEWISANEVDRDIVQCRGVSPCMLLA